MLLGLQHPGIKRKISPPLALLILISSFLLIIHFKSSIFGELGGHAGVYPAGPAGIASERNNAKTTDPIIGNATLGFQEVLAIGLKERYDRRDVLTLMASYQNVQIEWQEAVRGEDIDRSQWPPSWGRNQIRPVGELGCYRSHLNALRKIVDNRWGTALIIEDDADWDIALKEQLTQLSRITKRLARYANGSVGPSTLTKSYESPYGSTWDLLWLGSCATPEFANPRSFSDRDGGQVHNVSYAQGGMACTFGYAVTYSSAQKMLGWLLDVSEPIDFTISSFCDKQDCVGVTPALIGSHKQAGSKRKDTDIWGRLAEERDWMSEVRDRAYTENVAHSAILDTLARVENEKQGTPETLISSTTEMS